MRGPGCLNSSLNAHQTRSNNVSGRFGAISGVISSYPLRLNESGLGQMERPSLGMAVWPSALSRACPPPLPTSLVYFPACKLSREKSLTVGKNELETSAADNTRLEQRPLSPVLGLLKYGSIYAFQAKSLESS
jgi:hypothetical protein